MTKPQEMMETIKFYCYRDLYKTCYSLKYFRMLFSHNCAEKKKGLFHHFQTH